MVTRRKDLSFISFKTSFHLEWFAKASQSLAYETSKLRQPLWLILSTHVIKTKGKGIVFFLIILYCFKYLAKYILLSI